MFKPPVFPKCPVCLLPALRALPTLLMLLMLPSLPGCAYTTYDASRATRPYPADLHVARSVDIQVFREGETIELVNATARSYRDFFLWINQRYVQHVDALPAAGSIRLSLWEFFDERGEAFNAGGFWRTEIPTAVRLVEIQTDDEQPLVGLITIRSERD